MYLEATYMANFEGTTDNGWYLDNRAIHHLTNNMENMHLRKEFKGTNKLIIGNGQSLSVTHVGHAFMSFRAANYSSTHTTITLKDMLLIPLITKNL